MRDAIVVKRLGSPVTRQYLYRIGGGKQYADVGAKAAMCVNHDRNCYRIMRARK